MELKGKGVLVTGGGSGIGQSIAVSLAAEGCKVAVAGRLGTTVGLAEIKNSIRVTNIYPGEVDTPILEDRTAPIADEQRARMLKSEDVAAAVLMVARLPNRAHVSELVIKPTYQTYM